MDSLLFCRCDTYILISSHCKPTAKYKKKAFLNIYRTFFHVIDYYDSQLVMSLHVLPLDMSINGCNMYCFVIFVLNMKKSNKFITHLQQNAFFF